MPAVDLAKAVVLEELPKAGFGVPEIYARVPEDEHPEDLCCCMHDRLVVWRSPVVMYTCVLCVCILRIYS